MINFVVTAVVWLADNGECEERLAPPRKLAAYQKLLDRMTERGC